MVHITLPPLRERSDDIPLLIAHFEKKYTKQNKMGALTVSQDALRTLLRYKWPGNIRELENVIERAVILCSDDTIEDSDLPEEVRETGDPEFDIDRFVPHQCEALRSSRANRGAYDPQSSQTEQ